MNDRFFVLMQAMSGNDRHETRFEEYHSLADAEAMIQGWMMGLAIRELKLMMFQHQRKNHKLWLTTTLMI